MNYYDSYSTDLSHIADRRRIGLWINRSDFVVKNAGGSDINIHILTPFSDPILLDKLPSDTRIILDLVDGYLTDKPHLVKDILRYFLRTSKFRALLKPKRFSTSLENVCSKVDLVVVASNEQAAVVERLNPNVLVIRDCHDELGPPLQVRDFKQSDNFNVFWEGLGFTLFHFREIASELGLFLLKTNSLLHLVTNENFPKYGDKFGTIRTRDLVKDIFGLAANHVVIHKWTQEKVIEVALNSDFGIIPINEKDQFARLKPENKLLIYWRLGLPTLFSDTPSYLRVAKAANVTGFSVQSGEWGHKLGELASTKESRVKNMGDVRSYLLQTHSKQVILRQWKVALESLSHIR